MRAAAPCYRRCCVRRSQATSVELSALFPEGEPGIAGSGRRSNLYGRVLTALTRRPAKSAVVRAWMERNLSEARLQLLADPSLSPGERSLLERVSLACHPRDIMFRRGHAAVYLRVGLATVHHIDTALLSNGEGIAIHNVLDMGCGFGRILRFLRARFPNATVVACDVDREAVRFCAQAFSAVAIRSTESFDDLRLPGAVDLIWSGSLLTHLDPASATRLLRFFYRHLSPGGLCIFTTHGATSAEWLESGHHTYSLNTEGQTLVLAGYRATGYGFAEYERSGVPGKSYISLDRTGRPRMSHYGMSLISPEGATRLAHPEDQWHQVFYRPHSWGWQDHQDLYVWTRARNS